MMEEPTGLISETCTLSTINIGNFQIQIIRESIGHMTFLFITRQ